MSETPTEPSPDETPEPDEGPQPGINDPHPDGAGTDEPLTPM